MRILETGILLQQPEYETLLVEFWWMNCPCCNGRIIPFTVGRLARCPICKYGWKTTCVIENVSERIELRDTHLAVIRDLLETGGEG